MAKKNPASLSGMQGAIAPDAEVSQEMILASQIAVDNSNQLRQATGKSVIYKLVDTTRRGNFYLTLIDDVKARPPGTGNERIRVLQGVDTIWQKDQKDISPDYIKRNRRKLLFQKGVAIVREDDVAVHEFMDRFNGNIDNPTPTIPRNTKVFKWNPEKQAEELSKKEDFEIKAILTAQAIEDEEAIRQHASYLGISFVDGLGEPLPPKGIKNAYIRFAKANPTIFMESLGSKEVKVTYMVKKALQDSKIDTGRGNNNIYWSDGGMIGKLPVSQTAVNFLVTLAMQNSDEGKAFLENLQHRVS